MDQVIDRLDDNEPPFLINGKRCHGLEGYAYRDLYKDKPNQYLASNKTAEKYRIDKPETYDPEECQRAFYMHENQQTEVEVITPAGRIDCLNKKEIVEIKKARNWKSGIGQLLCYSAYYPNHIKVLILFNMESVRNRAVVEEMCVFHKIDVRWR